ncbi:MAG: hypothetical protein LBT06_10220 [Hungatella sp.]|jgi:hypothetical protein|nr:hypothetical protein [Hungatella sp.]
MDLNFHYFAVKAIAVTAGFSEPEAQEIATFSQYIDDFDWFKLILLNEVPGYARHLAKNIGIGYLFNPVTTGFPNWYDMLLLAAERYQKWIVTPYHFIPGKCLRDMPDDHTWRVKPAHMNDQSLITDMLKKARDTFIREGETNRKINLMRIGMLLHTFADTCAHQSFNGFHGWQNYTWLDKVTNNIDGKDITGDYSPAMYHNIYAVGHAEANHAPDDSNVTFNMRQYEYKDGQYSRPYSRNNTEEFLELSREIADFLLSCRNEPKMSDGNWNLLSEKLKQGFKTPLKDPEELAKHWAEIFCGISSFSYDKNAVLSAMLKPCGELLDERMAQLAEANSISGVVFEATDKFFWYNVLADEMRTAVVGTVFTSPLTEELAKQFNAG